MYGYRLQRRRGTAAGFAPRSRWSGPPARARSTTAWNTPAPAWPSLPEHAEYAPRGFDATAPNVARMCDYHLGGKDNYAADRELADRVLREAPVFSRLVRANRAFLGHAARFLAEQAGIRQFLDLGCGLPADDDLGDIVRRIQPARRVVYVDNDPMVLSHARALLAVDGGTGACDADLRASGQILDHPDVRRLIDLTEPVGVFLAGVLHFITDIENPYGIVADLLTGLPAGSHVVISHAERTPDLDTVSLLYQEADVLFTPRSRQEIAELFRGLEMVPRHSGDLEGGGAMPLIGRIGRKPR